MLRMMTMGVAIALSSSVIAQTTAPTPATTRATAPRTARALPPTSLPGNGLSQHPFLYCGEWDTRNPDETIFLVKGGKVVWTYTMPDNTINKDGKKDLNEFDDIHLLSNGNVLFARKTGASEVNPEKQLVWNYDAPPGTEVHSAQPIGLDKVFLCQNGLPAKCLLIDKKTTKVEMEHELPVKDPTSQKGVHGQF